MKKTNAYGLAYEVYGMKKKIDWVERINTILALICFIGLVVTAYLFINTVWIYTFYLTH